MFVAPGGRSRDEVDEYLERKLLALRQVDPTVFTPSEFVTESVRTWNAIMPGRRHRQLEWLPRRDADDVLSTLNSGSWSDT